MLPNFQSLLSIFIYFLSFSISWFIFCAFFSLLLTSFLLSPYSQKYFINKPF
jgi:hypothetical protein